jgi:hypothetical protein
VKSRNGKFSTFLETTSLIEGFVLKPCGAQTASIAAFDKTRHIRHQTASTPRDESKDTIVDSIWSQQWCPEPKNLFFGEKCTFWLRKLRFKTNVVICFLKGIQNAFSEQKEFRL